MTPRRPLGTAGLLLAGTALTISLTACTEAATQEEAESAACTSLTAVEEAAADVRAVDSTTTVEEAEAAGDALRASLQELRAAAADVAQADRDAVEAAADGVRTAVAGIEPGQTIGAAVDQVVVATPSMDAALLEMQDGLGCP